MTYQTPLEVCFQAHHTRPLSHEALRSALSPIDFNPEALPFKAYMDTKGIVVERLNTPQAYCSCMATPIRISLSNPGPLYHELAHALDPVVQGYTTPASMPEVVEAEIVANVVDAIMRQLVTPLPGALDPYALLAGWLRDWPQVEIPYPRIHGIIDTLTGAIRDGLL